MYNTYGIVDLEAKPTPYKSRPSKTFPIKCTIRICRIRCVWLSVRKEKLLIAEFALSFAATFLCEMTFLTMTNKQISAQVLATKTC